MTKPDLLEVAGTIVMWLGIGVQLAGIVLIFFAKSWRPS